MICMSVSEYVCKLCGYVSRSKPPQFPECPACSPDVGWDSSAEKEGLNG